ncbi:MAG TPA: aspartyl protease family protein [Pirellulaceae bacterium]|nr:aspartyl protease family protein [Pirellulaceae bacterium]
MCSDGDTRPILRAEILLPDSAWLEVRFLIDTGADRTVFSADVLGASRLQSVSTRGHIGGIGGVVETEYIRTQIRFRRDDGVQVVFHGEYAALTDPDALEMSVLGRDILNLFAVIVDRPGDVVAILGGHHYYSIQRRP